jgi:hypothetical protein
MYNVYKIFYTDLLIPARFAATTYGPFIFIRPTYKNDVGLRAHELTHVVQFWKNPLFGLAYYFSKTARLRYEAEAYKAQLLHCTSDKKELFAQFLCKNYKLNITHEQALAALA